MNEKEHTRRRPTRWLLPIALLVVVIVLGVALCCGTALNVRYQIWRLDNELGAAQAPSIDALVAIGPPAVPALREALSSPRQATRSAAAKTLARIEAPEARAALAEALHDPNGDIRFAAVYGLMGSDDPALLAAFRTALGDRRADVRQMALYALQAYPPQTAIEELIGILKRPDENLRAEALTRLGDFPPAEVLGRLFERLPTEPDLAAGAREVILRCTGEDPGGQIELLLTWWAKNREALLQSAEPDGNNGEDERD